VGNDLLRRFNAIVNYEKREFYLVPNTHFDEPFDYSYSGIELYYSNGEIIIGDVAEGSPAAASGIQEGDVVIAVNRVFDQNLTQLKLALQTTGDKLKIIVRRKKELLEFEFRVKSIL
jgi:predicted metalloprotease with PDZ domain